MQARILVASTLLHICLIKCRNGKQTTGGGYIMLSHYRYGLVETGLDCSYIAVPGIRLSYNHHPPCNMHHDLAHVIRSFTAGNTFTVAPYCFVQVQSLSILWRFIDLSTV